MSSKPVMTPGPRHPITIEPNRARVVVSFGGRVVADTRAALVLRESTYPAVHYVPAADVDTTLLERTRHTTYCPFKGDCTYYSISVDGSTAKNAVWTYEAPYDAVAQIKGYFAFYPNRVDSIEER